MDGYSKADVDGIMRRFKLVLLLCAAVLVAPLLGLWIYLDWRLDSFEADLRYRPPSATGDETVGLGELPLEPVQGQTVYVPVYSHIYHQRGRPQLLTITLSVRNTDLEREILLTSVRYYDTSGREVKSHLEKPLRISALATIEFVVARDDTTGGSGANFIVEWVAGEPVPEPVVEAVMIDTSGNQGISFVRRATPIEEK